MCEIIGEKLAGAIGSEQFPSMLTEYLGAAYPDLSCCDLEDKWADDVSYRFLRMGKQTESEATAVVAVKFKELTQSDCCDLPRVNNVSAKMRVTIDRESGEMEFEWESY